MKPEKEISVDAIEYVRTVEEYQILLGYFRNRCVRRTAVLIIDQPIGRRNQALVPFILTLVANYKTWNLFIILTSAHISELHSGLSNQLTMLILTSPDASSVRVGKPPRSRATYQMTDTEKSCAVFLRGEWFRHTFRTRSYEHERTRLQLDQVFASEKALHVIIADYCWAPFPFRTAHEILQLHVTAAGETKESKEGKNSARTAEQANASDENEGE